MATYNQLLALSGDATNLDGDIRVAIALAAEAVRTEIDTTPNHVNRLKWAAAAMADPAGQVQRFKWAVLAQKQSLTPTQIRQLSDADLLAAVLTAVDLFAQG